MDYTTMDSPVGRLLLAADEAGLRLISFPEGSRAQEPKPGWRHNPGSFKEVIAQLRDYFAGKRSEFDLLLAPQGTAFQLAVWKALCDIPYGETISYGELARRIGRPSASRAVGAANGANPLPIVVPCHRVIGSTGKLTGFGGGLETKAALLALEQGGRMAGGKQMALPLAG